MERVVITPSGRVERCTKGPECTRHGAMPLANTTSGGSLEDFIHNMQEPEGTQLPDGDAVESETDARLVDPRTVFSIPVHRVDEAQARVAKANQRLKRAGIEDEFTVELGEPTVVQVNGANVMVQSFIVNKPVLKVNGWNFAAAHEFTANGDTTSFVADPAIQAKLDATAITNACEHCGSKRHRERVYWLKNESGEVKQVGSNCLQGFLGIKPAGLWAMESDLTLTSMGGGDMRDSTVFDREQLITAALAASDDGESYTPKWSGTRINPSTAERVESEWQHFSSQPFSATRMEQARKILGWLDSSDDASKGTYLGDLKAAVSGGNWIKRKHLALAVSAIGAYQRAEREEVANARKRAALAEYKQGYLANVGEKIEQVEVTVVSSKVVGSRFSSNLLRLKTSDGHAIFWSSSNLDWEKGDKLLIESGKVTEHKVFNDVHETVITRPRVKALA
jgi:hypothetical protein